MESPLLGAMLGVSTDQSELRRALRQLHLGSRLNPKSEWNRHEFSIWLQAQ